MESLLFFHASSSWGASPARDVACESSDSFALHPMFPATRPLVLACVCVAVALGRAEAQTAEVSSALLAPDLTLVFETAPFDPENHEVLDAGDERVIDGCEVFYGTDNTMPETVLRSAHVLLSGEWFALDTSCMFACAFCVFDASEVTAIPNPGGAGYRLDGRFSDGAGTYVASWLATPNGTARIRIESGMQVMGPERPRWTDPERAVQSLDEAIVFLQDVRQAIDSGPVSPADAMWIEALIAHLEQR